MVQLRADAMPAEDVAVPADAAAPAEAATGDASDPMLDYHMAYVETVVGVGGLEVAPALDAVAADRDDGSFVQKKARSHPSLPGLKSQRRSLTKAKSEKAVQRV